jgi:ketopantoate reductase
MTSSTGAQQGRARLLPGALTTHPSAFALRRSTAWTTWSWVPGRSAERWLVRDGNSVLFCDTDPDHVTAMNEHGLAIEGPVEEFAVPAQAVLPDALPNRLGAVLLAVKAHDTASAMSNVAPRLAEDGFVVSLQNGLNEPVIAASVGVERTVGAFVNFGADYLGPGRIFLGGEARSASASSTAVAASAPCGSPKTSARPR